MLKIGYTYKLLKKMEPRQKPAGRFFLLKREIVYKLRSVLNLIKYGQATFLDTNISVRQASESDAPARKFGRNTRYFVTESIEHEVSDKEKSGFMRTLDRPKKVIQFADMRKQDASLCPVYYNLISWMYNPANIASPEFTLHMIQSLKLRERQLTATQTLIYNRSMDRIKHMVVSELNAAGDPKTRIAEHIDQSFFQYFQKKVKNRASENLLNDYKNAALMLLYALKNKTNVTLVTADRDILAILLTLSESLAQGMTFMQLILSSLNEEDKQTLFKAHKITRFFDFSEFKKIYEGVLGDILNVYWKRDCVRFRVKLWDSERKKYIKDFSMNFDEISREMILNMHGPLSCHFAKNDTYGNWLHYRFWPPLPKSPVVKVMLSVKKVKSRHNILVSDAVHTKNCKYALDDKAGKLKNYFGFWL